MTELRFYRHPVEGPITQRFGEYFSGYAHRGTDYGIPLGTPVYAPADGIVVVPNNDGSFGVAVCLHHVGTGYYSLYAHLSTALVSMGQQVKAGEVLGHSGSTGVSTGPHLHWQVANTPTFPANINTCVDGTLYIHPEDEPMTPQERMELDAMKVEMASLKRVLCEWGQPGRLTQLDSAGIDVYQGMFNQNTALEGMKAAMRAAGIPI